MACPKICSNETGYFDCAWFQCVLLACMDVETTTRRTSFLTQQQTRDLEHWKNNSERLEYEESRASRGGAQIAPKDQAATTRG